MKNIENEQNAKEISQPQNILNMYHQPNELTRDVMYMYCGDQTAL